MTQTTADLIMELTHAVERRTRLEFAHRLAPDSFEYARVDAAQKAERAAIVALNERAKGVGA